jgi:hypothetical protein
MMRREQFSNGFAYASLACTLAFWLVMGLDWLLGSLHIPLPGWLALLTLTGSKWALVELFGLLLAIIAAVLGLFTTVKLWWIALPVSLLMVVLVLRVMWS